MTLNDKPLDMLEEADIQRLMEDEVPESKVIDYKRRLPGPSDLEKREFLRDVSSFANASGGHLIYGVAEENGVPVKIPGLAGIDPDKEILRLDSMVQTGISMRAVPLENERFVIVVRIPKSWASPHMITKGSSRFYSRNSAGKYPLDVFEIRTAFSITGTAAERMRDFRADALAKIVAGETPTPLNEGPKMILQVVPSGAFEPSSRFDVSSLVRSYKRGKGTLPLPLTGLFSGWRYNFDGLLTYDDRGSYSQTFVSGIIEAVDSVILGDQSRDQMEPESERMIPSSRFEETLLEALPKYTCIQEHLEVEPPVFFMLSLLGVEGRFMQVDIPAKSGIKDVQIDRDALLVPEIMVESFEYSPEEVLRPAFDAVWRAAGWEKSMNYDEEGRRIGRR
ncbi:MAG: Putative transcriptional regulator [Methanothrix harundinacea]|uniref:Putative transcriptional regulator n=1 Tax=Methanothrix harundinacea TaxID=301375 RepID=A0A101IMP2_9EURY|nr:MAG: Putative transcriptional regulator [Methanothrix harundinacea]